MTARRVAFTVTGEFLTGFSRDRLIEGRFDAALDALQCLNGITIEQCFSVLRGEQRLTGDSNVGVGMEADDASEGYLNDLDYIYGGVWNNNGRYMQPYAKVTSWGEEDMRPTTTTRGLGGVEGRRKRYTDVHSSLHYANDEVNDVCTEEVCPEEILPRTDILWGEVRNFPHMVVTAHKTSAAAFDANRKPIGERGYCGGYTELKAIDKLVGGTFNREKVATSDEHQPADLEKLKAKIWDQNGDQTYDIGNRKVPLKPFLNWCLWRGDGAHLAPEWETICPSGMKMLGDDPYHTDFMVGADIPLHYHDDQFTSDLFDARAKVQKEYMGFDVAVLCGIGKSTTLTAVHPKPGQSCKPNEVAIIPNAGPKYVEAAMSAGAVICQQGGQMAHLVTVGREANVKIVRVPKARTLYPKGMALTVDCDKGRVEVPYERQDYKMKLGGVLIDLGEIV